MILPGEPTAEVRVTQRGALDEAQVCYQGFLAADAHRTDLALRCGEALLQLKTEAGHGGWADVLERTGVPERSARRWMRLADHGLRTAVVTGLGGLRATDEWLGRLRAAWPGYRQLWPCIRARLEAGQLDVEGIKRAISHQAQLYRAFEDIYPESGPWALAVSDVRTEYPNPTKTPSNDGTLEGFVEAMAFVFALGDDTPTATLERVSHEPTGDGG